MSQIKISEKTSYFVRMEGNSIPMKDEKLCSYLREALSQVQVADFSLPRLISIGLNDESELISTQEITLQERLLSEVELPEIFGSTHHATAQLFLIYQPGEQQSVNSTDFASFASYVKEGARILKHPLENVIWSEGEQLLGFICPSA